MSPMEPPVYKSFTIPTPVITINIELLCMECNQELQILEITSYSTPNGECIMALYECPRCHIRIRGKRIKENV